jgi:hypothetical protein
MELTKRIDQTVSQYITPKLRQYGFRKSGRAFWRGKSPVTDVITIQKAQHNTSEKADFTINLGSYWHDIQEDIGRSIKRWPPREYDCTVFERIGFLFNNNCDYWWQTTCETDIELIGLDVANKIILFGLPWLEEGHDIKVILSRAKKHFFRLQMDAVEASIKCKYGIE